MRPIAALLLPLVALAAQPAAAQVIAYAPVAQEVLPGEGAGAERLLAVELAPVRRAPEAYGPFRVLDEGHAALVGVTDAATPAQFAAMLRDHPTVATIEMIDCPGTEDDRANLALGLMIRHRGIATHVPENGWVASGAVELFLAGLQRSAEAGARFAVHSWQDDAGFEPQDYAPDAPKNRTYLDYYEAIGMSAPEARAFYAMTNSVPFESARMLSRAEMAQWVRMDENTPFGGPVQLAALDSFPGVQ
jgi:hypothetical protein